MDLKSKSSAASSSKAVHGRKMCRGNGRKMCRGNGRKVCRGNGGKAPLLAAKHSKSSAAASSSTSSMSSATPRPNTHTHYYHIKGVKTQGGGSEEREGDEHRTGCSTKLACRAGPRRVAAGAPEPPQPRWNRISCVRHIQTTIGERLAGQRTAERRPKARTH